MEIKEGTLLIKIKGGKHWKKRHVKIDNKDVSISKEFQLDILMNNKNCLVYLDSNNKIIDIEIDGKKIDKIVKKIVKKFVRCENKNNLRVPNDTCVIIDKFQIKNIDNFHLKLNKFTIFNNDDEPKIKEQNISETFFNRKWSLFESKIKNYYKNIENLGLNSKSFIFKIDYRLVIGAEESIYETSMRLHHIYGIPFIPSTAIKGSFRNCIIQRCFNGNEKKALKRDWFVNIFGSQDQEGKIIFFDAFPTTEPKIKVDIMNPHYGHYYNEGKAPTDTNNPIPINFLTVEDTTFQFFIASKEKIDKSFITLFKKSLQNHGIGAKTAVGYGYFNKEKKL